MTRDRGGGSRDEGRGACDGQCEASFVPSERSDERSSVAIGVRPLGGGALVGGRTWEKEEDYRGGPKCRSTRKHRHQSDHCASKTKGRKEGPKKEKEKERRLKVEAAGKGPGSTIGSAALERRGEELREVGFGRG